VYDDKLYNNLNETPLTTTDLKAYDNFSSQGFGQHKIENFEQEAKDVKSINYNIPVINNQIPNYNNIDVSKFNTIETFNESKTDYVHDDYQNHVSNCIQCKEKLLKQWNVESDRLRNEEILELVSYVMLGLFILVLLDTLKKD
jgi:hypothetical protein